MHTLNINDQMKNTPSFTPTIINNPTNSLAADYAKALPPVDALADAHVFTVGKDVNPYRLTEDHFIEMLMAPRMNSGLLVPYHGHISTVALEINYDSAETFTYKKVTNRIKPVATTLPEKFRIVRRIPSDLLAKLPILPTQPPEFMPGSRYTEE